MPLGILLNRLSRPKESETPADQLEKGRVILLEEMLPIIHPDAAPDRDYLYREDIVSRMKSHQEGELLAWALGHMRRGRVSWLAVTEIARITGDVTAFGEIMELCEIHRIRIHTRNRTRHPYEPWRADSRRELWIEFFLAVMEIVNYQDRAERRRDSAYPIDAATGKKRLQTFEGIGRHLNGAVPMGYLWDPREKRVLPADRIPQDIPCPTYVPPGEERPPAYTWWEIARRLRDLGRRMGVNSAVRTLYRETGVQLLTARVTEIWRNPFYAGRPTTTKEMRGRRLVRREEPLSTTGNYPAIDTWEEHLALQAAMDYRLRNGTKSLSPSWATGLLKCECGMRFVAMGEYYRCAGPNHALKMKSDARLSAEWGMADPVMKRRPIAGWQRTATCGAIGKDVVHTHVEKHLRKLFRRSDLSRRVALWKESASKAPPDREQLVRQETETQAELRRNSEHLKRARDYLVRGSFSEAEFEEQRDALGLERLALVSRLQRLREEIAAPVTPSAVFDALEAVIRLNFDEWWAEADPALRATIAGALIDHVPVHAPIRGKSRHRTLGDPVWANL